MSRVLGEAAKKPQHAYKRVGIDRSADVHGASPL
jgi:hypothetical protein